MVTSSIFDHREYEFSFPYRLTRERNMNQLDKSISFCIEFL
ncbi:hypothetical protein MYA_5610 [Burkholderia sp. KJ006]|nr:hypothetical protein MYA_5610 [Burkholderia sp. KJ006]